MENGVSLIPPQLVKSFIHSDSLSVMYLVKNPLIARTVYPSHPSPTYNEWMLYIRAENDKLRLGCISQPIQDRLLYREGVFPSSTFSYDYAHPT